MSSQTDELPPNVIKGLFEKNTEKREAAGQQLEVIISKSIDARNLLHVERIIYQFHEKYIKSQTPHFKRSALEALYWTAQGLKDYPEDAAKFVQAIVRPVLSCFNDSDPKTKFTAIKSMYYICKCLEEVSVRVFNIIFEGVLQKITDSDDEVRNAVQLLNVTLKTMISDALSDNIPFDLTKFMAILTEHLKDTSSKVREFLIDWINTIDEIPSTDLSVYLPKFLEDVMFMLGDKEKELRSKAEECLKAFLFDLKEKFYSGKLESTMTEENMAEIVTILLNVCKGKSSAFSKLTAIVWFQEIFEFLREQVEQKTKIKHKYILKKVILERFDEILEPILLLLANEEEEVRKAAATVNQQLLSITQLLKRERTVDFGKVMPLLKNMLYQKKSSTTSESVLTWMKFLLQNYNDEILPEINDIIQKLVEELCDGSTKNVMGIIENVSLNTQHLDLVIEKLLSLLFQNKSGEVKTEDILKKFFDRLDPEKTFISICQQIQSYDDSRFIEMTVNSLNFLLATDKALAPIRKKIKQVEDQLNLKLFNSIFKAFSYSAVATLTLSYLVEEYQLAYLIIHSLSQEVVTNETIANLCTFVNVFESPSLVFVRLQMLQRYRYPYLVESIYALMMLIPQGKIYNILKNRIETVNHVKNAIKLKEPQKVYKLDAHQYLADYMAKHKRDG